MSFTLWTMLPPEMRGLIVSKGTIKDVLNYFGTAKWAREELSNEWFWKLKTEHDFERLGIKVEPSITGWKDNYFFHRRKVCQEFSQCITEEKIKRVWEILDGGINIGLCINSQDKMGWTALIIASRFGHLKLVQVLLNRGADPNIQSNDGDTALMDASYGGHINIVRYLLNARAEVNARDNMDSTALIDASFKGHSEIVEELLDWGADINAKDHNKYTALIHASEEGCISTVQKLVDRGADLNLQTSTKYTALIAATEAGRTEIVQILLKAGADPNLRDMHEATALDIAEGNVNGRYRGYAIRRKFHDTRNILTSWRDKTYI